MSMSATRTRSELTRQFLTALEEFDTGALNALLSPDLERIEMPNRLKPEGGAQGKDQVLADAARAETVIRSQSYAVLNTTEADNLVMIEMVWTGVLAIDIGALKAGDTMRAQCVAVFEFTDGRISGLRNYDCFDAF